MSRIRPTVVTAVVALLVLALATSAAGFVLVLSDVDALPLQVATSSPVLWPFGRRTTGLAVLVLLAQLVVIAVVGALVTALAGRGAAPGRGFWPVLFAVWLAATVAGYLAGPLALPYLLQGFRADVTLLFQQGLSAASRGGAWGLYYGWVAGLVAALVHRATGVRPTATSFPGS